MADIHWFFKDKWDKVREVEGIIAYLGFKNLREYIDFLKFLYNSEKLSD